MRRTCWGPVTRPLGEQRARIWTEMPASHHGKMFPVLDQRVLEAWPERNAVNGKGTCGGGGVWKGKRIRGVNTKVLHT